MAGMTWREQAHAAFVGSIGAPWDAPLPFDDPEAYRRAVDRALDVAEQAIRTEVYDMLGHDHYVIFGPDGWVVEHSVDCRLAGQMADCEYHEAVRVTIGLGAPVAGRWCITHLDDDGLPVLERAAGG